MDTLRNKKINRILQISIIECLRYHVSNEDVVVKYCYCEVNYVCFEQHCNYVD